MRVLVIGDKPSNKNGKSPTLKCLNRWMFQLGVHHYGFTNSSENTSLYDEAQGFHKVITLGQSASKICDRLNIKHFKLPHPSPRNRLLNDVHFVQIKLIECSKYLWS